MSEEQKVSRSRELSPHIGSVASGQSPWKCPSCFLETTPAPVQIRREDRTWADSSVQHCPLCKHTFGGTLEDQVAHLSDVYDYKYFGDYELSEEQADAVWSAKVLADHVPGLVEALKRLIPTNINLDHPGLSDDTVLPCDVTLGELRAVRSAIAKAEGRQ